MAVVEPFFCFSSESALPEAVVVEGARGRLYRGEHLPRAGRDERLHFRVVEATSAEGVCGVVGAGYVIIPRPRADPTYGGGGKQRNAAHGFCGWSLL